MVRAWITLHISLILIVVIFQTAEAQIWRGNNYPIIIRYRGWTRYCNCLYGWGCSNWRYYYKSFYRTAYLCRSGYTHNGDFNCIIPVCRPTCKNGGTCTSPNTCDCPDTTTGPSCEAFTCSYVRPCYPGDCGSGLANNCKCDSGFVFNQSSTGCTEFDPNEDNLKPTVGNNNVTISNIRTDNSTNYMFILEGSHGDETEMVWSNQRRFNRLKFYVESLFEAVELPQRPDYVHSSEIGIVETLIEANVSKVPRDGGLIRDGGSFKIYPCTHLTQDNPETNGVAKCTIVDDQFRTLIEHGDWMHVKIKTKSGGYQRLFNADQGRLFPNKHYYQGLQVIKSFQFMFDFIAPKHCSENGAWETCTSDSVMLKVDNEFTKEPIRPRWKGWTDDLSGMWEYYVEVFKLEPDPYDRLVEADPLKPKFAVTLAHNNSIAYPEFRPDAPGMYSVLVEARDISNNSRIARRLVLYDNVSKIELNDQPDGQLYISSAVEETGYMWQTTSSTGNKLRIDVKWANHFINKIHEDNKLLNQVLDYPIQFKDLEDDGLLSVKKYVAAQWDDSEGMRTKAKIPNFLGIIKFEMAKEFTLEDTEPLNGWEDLPNLAEEFSFEEALGDGARVRVWVRATDAMGNTRTDSTLMRVDGTRPTVSSEGQTNHKFVKNIKYGPYKYSSSLQFVAKDDQSGVFKFGIKLVVHTPGKDDQVVYEGFEPAMVFDNFDNAACDNIEGKFFIPSQDVKINNCWFLIPKEDLATSSGTVEIFAYNQALLTTNTSMSVGPISSLQGLEKYDGPTNFKIETKSDKGFRLSWTLPEQKSCYDRAIIQITLITGQLPDGNFLSATFYTSGTSTYYNFFGLNSNTDYKLNIALQSYDGSYLGELTQLQVKTDPEPEPAASNGVIVGVAVGVMVIVSVVVFSTCNIA